MSISADFAQTFYIDKATVKGAGYAFVNGVDLFFKDKPPVNGSTASITNSAGQLIPNPGVVVYICPTTTVNGVPVPDLSAHVKYGYKRLTHAQINTSTTGLVATTFTFPTPVPIATDQSYAVVIRCDGNDSQYSLWRNKAGETYNGIQNPTVTKGSLDGQFFVITNGTVPTPLTDTDLKFVLRGQKFSTTNTVYSAVNRSFEFLTLDRTQTTGSLIGGELVFANTGYVSSQTVSVSTTSNTVIGTGTTFTATYDIGDHIVVNSSGNNNARRITAIANNTRMSVSAPFNFTNTAANYLVAPVATVHDYNFLNAFVILSASSANATHNFIANNTSTDLIGTKSGASVRYVDTLDIPVSYFNPEFKVLSPVGTSSNVAVKMANQSYATDASGVEVKLFDKNPFTRFRAFVASRSNEVTNPAALTNTKSVNFDITFGTTNEFVTPLLDEEDLIYHITGSYINNDLTGEMGSRGMAQSKSISKKVNIANNQLSEDVKVYVTAHRPAGTDVEVFIKFYNNEDSETFENTSWTRLRNISPVSLTSAVDNEQDLVELEYELPTYPLTTTSTTSSGTLLNAGFSIDRNTDRIFANTTTDISTLVSENSVIRIFNPLFPETSLLTVATGVDENMIKIANIIDESDPVLAGFIGSGYSVEVVENATSAFKDITNSGVLKYYNVNRSSFSGYNAFAVKVILTASPETAVVPLVDDIRVLAVSV